MATCARVAALCFALAAACTTNPTEVVVTMNTDAPAGRTVRVQVTVLEGAPFVAADGGLGDAGGSWQRGAGGSLRFPASFGVVPRLGQPHNGTITLVFDVDFAATSSGDPATSLRRTARVAFVPDTVIRMPLFFALACARAATGCTTVAASRCTESVLCHERPGQTCGDQGTCVPIDVRPGSDAGVDGGRCGTGLAACAGACVDLSNDPQHCGACDHACVGSASCVGGVCSSACSTGQSVCGGMCVDLQGDPSNCGACGTVCPTDGGTAVCTVGSCGVVCPSGQMVCGGSCRDVQSDTGNCGSCGNNCPSASGGGASCSGGHCAFTCPSGRSFCGSNCVDLASDGGNCGGCGHGCGGGSVSRSCSGGRCVPDCSGRINGYYCGSDLVGGNANTVYICTGGVPTYAFNCPNGCRVQPSGTNDNCNANCSGRVNGLYCGNDLVGGDPTVLYACNGGAYSVSQFCTAGCSVQPAGTNDLCR